jgi:Polysaccharide lyase
MRRAIYTCFLAFAVSLCFLATEGFAQSKFDHGDFSRFMFAPNQKAKSYAAESNPDGTAELVESFYIDGTKCRGDDCNFGSVRSQLKTNIWDDGRPRSVTSPKQAWYSFEIYFPRDFPYGMNQARGSYHFTEFKESKRCPTQTFSHVNGYNDNSLYLYLFSDATDKESRFYGKSDDCYAYFEGGVGDMTALVGKWTRFEFFVHWSDKDDGKIEVYRNGRRVLSRNGQNCNKIENCLERNIFYYGIYKPNNKDLKSVRPAKVYFRNVSMAQKREDLVR